MRQERHPPQGPGRRERPDQGGEGRDPEEQPGAVQHEVSDREEQRAAGPLEARREPGDAVGEVREALQVLDPPRIQPEGERARSREGGGKRHANGERGCGEDDGEAQGCREEPPAARAAGLQARKRAHEDADADREQQGERRDLAGRREAEANADARVLDPPRAALRDAHGSEQDQRGERRQEGVHRPEVRQLNRESAEGKQSRRVERRGAAREAPRDPVDEEDRQQVEERRKDPAHQVCPVIAGLVEEHPAGLGQHDRQRAVHERAEVAVVGIQGRPGRVEVLGDAPREGELLLDHRDEPLIGMEVVAPVPREAVEAQDRPGRKDQGEKQPGSPAAHRHEGSGACGVFLKIGIPAILAG